MTHRSEILISWCAVFVYAAFIFYLSSLSHPPVPYLRALEKYNFDKVLHGVEYGVLGILLSRALSLTWELSGAWLFFAAFILGSLYGASDEWHQSFVPLRECNIYDWTADSAGTALGIWIYGRNKKF